MKNKLFLTVLLLSFYATRATVPFRLLFLFFPVPVITKKYLCELQKRYFPRMFPKLEKVPFARQEPVKTFHRKIKLVPENQEITGYTKRIFLVKRAFKKQPKTKHTFVE
jgi:hypothetical protein